MARFPTPEPGGIDWSGHWLAGVARIVVHPDGLEELAWSVDYVDREAWRLRPRVRGVPVVTDPTLGPREVRYERESGEGGGSSRFRRTDSKRSGG